MPHLQSPTQSAGVAVTLQRCHATAYDAHGVAVRSERYADATTGRWATVRSGLSRALTPGSSDAKTVSTGTRRLCNAASRLWSASRSASRPRRVILPSWWSLIAIPFTADRSRGRTTRANGVLGHVVHSPASSSYPPPNDSLTLCIARASGRQRRPGCPRDAVLRCGSQLPYCPGGFGYAAHDEADDGRHYGYVL